ncbi:MAG: SH3 domain-containing protein [Mariprofundus sp.]
MAGKPTEEPENFQRQLNSFVEGLDHQLMESDATSRNDKSEPDGASAVTAAESMESVQASVDTGHRFKILFGLFAGSTALMLSLIWFVWPVVQVEQAGDAASAKATETISSPVVQPTRPDLPAVESDAPVPTVEHAGTRALAPPEAEAVQASLGVEQAYRPQLRTVGVNVGLIRSAPGKEGRVVARLRRGTGVRTVSRQGDWLQVHFPGGRNGWGHRDIFAALPSVAEVVTQSLAVATEPAVVKPDRVVESKEKLKQAGQVNVSQAKSVTESTTLTAVAAVSAYTPQLRTISVALGLIRDAPGKQGAVVVRLKRGSDVWTVAQQGDWLQVHLPDGRVGWGHQSVF